MLPTTLLPAGYLDTMRNQARQFFTETVEVYNITLSYAANGQQVVSSGLAFTASGYVGKVSGKDQELLLDKRSEGSMTETTILVLLPHTVTVEDTQVVKAQGKDWRIIWNNEDLQDSVQLYVKLICAERVQIPEKRYTNG